jgi:very-short-patch-repair endonuclease
MIKTIKEIKESGIENGLLISSDRIKNIFNSSNIDEIKDIIYNVYTKRENKKESKTLRLKSSYIKRTLSSKIKLEKIALDFRSSLISKQTESEKIFKAILKSIKINYQFQKIIYTKISFYIVDFYLTDFNKVIEIDGGYHESKEQKIKDSTRSNILIKKVGVSGILRFKNEEVKNTERVISEIKHFLKI